MTHDWLTALLRRPPGTTLVVDRTRPELAIYVTPGWSRRLGWHNSMYATRSELRSWHRAWDTE